MELAASASRLVALILLMGLTMHMIQRILRNCIKRKGYPLPPGPTALHLLGSALSVDAQSMWLTFTEWREKYGDVIYLRLFNLDVIVLNSTSVATELLEKRSQIFSDRPSFAVSSASLDFHMGFARYGEHWKFCRRIFQQTFRADATLRFHPMHLRKARQLIVNMIDTPDEYPLHLSMFSAAVALSATYGYEPGPRDDPMVSIIDGFYSAAVPEVAPVKMFLITAFPFLMHIPDWLPGSWIKRDAKIAYECRNQIVETPYRYSKERMESTDHMNASMVSDHITLMKKSDGSYHSEYETALKHTSATTLTASIETTSATLMTFTLAMVQNPRVWKRAQAEIDAVVGINRLPEFDDRPSLPYVDTIMREVFRWRPVLPLGVPHGAIRSDTYEGYYIPKGAVVVANAWAMSRDEIRYPDANRFVPERFLDEKGLLTDDDPSDFVFGFGRRRCPGGHIADASVWGAIVTMLATLDFNLAKGADGDDLTFTATLKGGATERPHPFPCRITLRPHVDKEMLERVLTK